MTDEPKLGMSHHFKIETRNPDGEVFEVVEINADDSGQVTAAKVTERKHGLAPPEAYATEISAEE